MALSASPFQFPAAGDIGNMLTAFSMQTTVDFNRASILRRLTNDRSNEVNSAYQVVIQDPTYTTMAIGDRLDPDTGNPTSAYDRSSRDWPTGTEPSGAQITLEVNRKAQDARNLQYLDATEAPIPYMERMRAKLAATITTDMENDYYEFISQSTFYDATGVDNGREFEIPSADLTLSHDGTVGGTLKFAAFYDALWDFNVHYVNKSVIGPAAGVMIGGSAGMPYAVMPPEVFKEFAKWFLKQRYSWDTLTEQIISQNSILASSAFRGSVAGVPLLVTPAVTAPKASVAGTDYWYVQMGFTQANSVAVRPPLTQFLTPTINQENTDYELKQIVYHGRERVNKELNARIKIATA